MPVTRGACPCRLKSDFLSVSEKQRAFGQAKSAALSRECRECKWLFTCQGKCPKNRVLKTPDGESALNWLCVRGVESVLRAHGAAHAGNGGPAEERALCGRDHYPEAGGGARHAAMSTQSNPRKTGIQTTEEKE